MPRFARHLMALALVCAALGVHAQVPSLPASASSTAAPAAGVATAAVPSTPGASTPELSADDLSRFFDGLIPFALERGDLAGAVVSVVKDGDVLLARGYGHANLATGQVPSPESSLYRPGSISKLFTWTAVMQQVEQGKLDLDADVNRYLDFAIPPRDGKPVTLRQLMTHTAGFEDTASGMFPASPAGVNLEAYLKSHIPRRIYDAGMYPAYSNFGCGLAAYIVQRVSGERFENYVDRHIFKPLGMRHSTFLQPVPPNLEPLQAIGYKTASDGVPKAFEMINPAPAGGLSSTAMDMARFMIAYLDGGGRDGASILRPETVRLMHTRQHTNAPGLNGMDLGFYDEDRNGQRIVGHAGDLDYFHSDLHLLLDAHVGIFVSFNSLGNEAGAHVVRKEILRRFLDRYYPQPAKPTAALPNAADEAAKVAGWYRSTRRNDSALRLFYLLGQTSVSPQPDHTIVVSAFTDAAGAPLRWHAVAPLDYRDASGTTKLRFVAGADGSIRYFATDEEVPVAVFQRVDGAGALGSVLLWLSLSGLVVFAAWFAWPIGAWMRHHYRRSLPFTQRAARFRLYSRLAISVLALEIVGWAALLTYVLANDAIPLLQGGITPALYVLYAWGVLALLAVAVIVAHAVGTWRSPRRGRWVRLGEGLLALGALYLAWFIVAFGLVSFSTAY
ncbi:serine hydrolase domain-containing protein [Luteibacter sp. Lutesp34]|uniref:serine hydrolase domain-containing protein n=1 Tax=Luteibacter sp. Lutesp34 TaxID=3243030 RepID=UPI0039B5AFE0